MFKIFRETGNCYSFGSIDQLSYTYESGTNKLQSIADGAPSSMKNNGYKSGAGNYQYDANGNMTYDPAKGLTITYNHLNLPRIFDFGSGNRLEMLYDANGTKLQKKVYTSNALTQTKDYVNGWEYTDGELEAIYNAYGRNHNTNVGTGNATQVMRYEYNITDHLGNVRLTYTDKDGDGVIEQSNDPAVSEVLQETHYYPFGLAMKGPWINDAGSQDNQYLYNGKELNTDFGLDWIDYGARWYDPSVARFHSIDPLAENYSFQNPFAYAANNPILFIDYMGMGPTWIKTENEDGSVTYTAEQGDSAKSLEEQHGVPFDIGNEIIQALFGKNLPSDAPEGRSNIHPGDQITIGAVSSESEGSDAGGFFSWLSGLFSESEQQQHSGENWTIYALGTSSGWDINAPKADPDGANRSIDIAGMFPAGGLLPPNINPVNGLGGFKNRVEMLAAKGKSLTSANDTIYSCEACSGIFRDSSGIKVSTKPDSSKPQKRIPTHLK